MSTPASAPAPRDGFDPLTASREEVEELQLARLQWTVRHAYENVPMYTEKFDAHGVHPDDLKSLEDLARFPYTEKEDLRRCYPFGMFAVPMERVRRIHASSGTTGQPTVVGYTEADLSIWADLVARCLHLSGVRAGDRVHNAYGYGLFTGGLGAHAGAERLGATVIPMSGGQTEKQIQLIQDFQPTAILCTPTYLLAIADAMQRQGLDPRATSLKTAVLGAEPWTEEMRRELELAWGIDACDIYGLSEVMGPGVAGESCETKDGSHIWEDHFRPEIIDPFEPERTMADGEPGELVFTSLTKQALPIIRYRTHDLTRLLPGSAAPGHRRMGRITGRSDDMIILRGVNLFPTQIEEIALGVPGLSPHFQLEITRPAAMDELTVRIEARPGTEGAARATAGAELRRLIKVRVGSSCAIEVVDPGTLARSSGKLKRIHDLRNR
ncbi:phenylacetate--CoA ligase family protein [Falsarthrobacter nasiphocae]|uniref:Phenylacetate-coenzyme A ligase n=1 Tax=Falsarthrobacter nasiphocae TaxID=189863 RepID=A0AAE3YEI6_9MICC|nr:AMP-binding protein [Falsarthrobacter nasiphocae]MDR6892398.1 phenylacetate-CoA ligase [Falsarthrobacter nasiphocae]